MLFKTNKLFQAIEKEDKLFTFYYFRAPEDARLDNSMIRADINTKCGAVVELHLLRVIQAKESSLQGRRFNHLLVNATNPGQLDHGTGTEQ